MEAFEPHCCMQKLTCAARESGLVLRAFNKSVSLASHSAASVGGPVTAVELAWVSSLYVSTTDSVNVRGEPHMSE
jgi:hypothetical protein